jgi:hypothetical protein
MVLSYEPVTSCKLGRTIIHLTPPVWHWYEPTFSNVVRSNMLIDPSSDPVMNFRSESLQST